MRQTSAESGEDLRIPRDLTEWSEQGLLLGWIEEELGRMNWGNPELVAHLEAHPNYRPRMMLTLLTYAYLTGHFESEPLVQGCGTDPVLHGICGNTPRPMTGAVRRFRRENRGLLRFLLQQTIAKSFRARFGLETALLPPGFKRHLRNDATERLELARQMDRAAQGA